LPQRTPASAKVRLSPWIGERIGMVDALAAEVTK